MAENLDLVRPLYDAGRVEFAVAVFRFAPDGRIAEVWAPSTTRRALTSSSPRKVPDGLQAQQWRTAFVRPTLGTQQGSLAPFRPGKTMRNKLIKQIRDSAIRLIGSLGVHVTNRTGRTELNNLIRSLHPIDSGAELIRLGPDGDGGYLIPDDLDGIQYVFSPGVSTESGFEADLAAKGIRVFLADFSVDRPAQANSNFVFDKKYVGSLSNSTSITLDEWKSNNIPEYDGDLLLQMDIEGAEYETLISSSAALLAQMRIMVIEFHYLHALLNKPYFDLASRVFQKILQTHSVVHIHPNNCCGSVKSQGLELPRIAEFTFHRNDRLGKRSPRRTFPHPLDRDNTRQPALRLPECWYQ